MGSEEIEEIRRKKLAQREAYLKEMQERKRVLDSLSSELRKFVDEKAYDRLSNVKVSNENLFALAAQQIIAIARRFGRPLSDEEVLAILKRLKYQTERETKISFLRK